MARLVKSRKTAIPTTTALKAHAGKVRRFAVIVTWPDVQNAEYEVVLRIQRAAKLINVECLLVNNEGFVLSSLGTENPRRLAAGDVDFALALHFESPKLFDTYSYTALWNPVEFYADWGYQKSTTKLVSHDDFVFSGSDVALRQVLRYRKRYPRLPSDALPFYPSIGDPIFPPTLGRQKIFYCGMNWEKINAQQGRHHDLLRLLDESGNLEIFGPDEFMGVKVWGDYKSYVRPLPFDGWSVINAIHDCGICLVLMSDAHFHSGIASSRLYEGLAAGALIITDDHEFFRSRLGDSVLYISALADGRKRFDEITDHLLWIRKNKSEALAKAQRAQEIYRSEFELTRSLEAIFEQTPRRQAALAAAVHAPINSDEINVIISFVSAPLRHLSRVFQNLASQRFKNIHFTLLVDRQFSREWEEQIRSVIPTGLHGDIFAFPFFDSTPGGNQPAQRLKRRGEAIQAALQHRSSSFFCIVDVAETWFEDHLLRMIKALDSSKALCAYSGVLLEEPGTTAVARRTLDFLDMGETSARDVMRLRKYPGCLLFKREVFDASIDYVLPDLDGLEHLLFASMASSKNGLVPTTSATYVRHIAEDSAVPPRLVSEDLQIGFLQDMNLVPVQDPAPKTAADDWSLLLSSKARDGRAFQRGARPYNKNSVLLFGKRGLSQDYMATGWSTPEDGWTWIEGVSAQLLMRPQLFVPDAPQFLRLDIGALIHPPLTTQTLTVRINEAAIATVHLKTGARTILSVPIAEGVLHPNEAFTIGLQCSNAVKPPGESRYLSVRVFSVFVGTGTHAAPELKFLDSDFDEKRYLQHNPDVASAVEEGLIESGYHHFITRGLDERRLPVH